MPQGQLLAIRPYGSVEVPVFRGKNPQGISILFSVQKGKGESDNWDTGGFIK